MKITELAPEHIARLDEWAEKWIQIALSTEPADFDLAVEAALQAYGGDRQDRPLLILRMGSPMAKQIAGSVGTSWLRELKKMPPEHLSDATLDQLLDQALTEHGAQLSEEIKEQIKEQDWDHIRDHIRTPVSEQDWTHRMDHVWDRLSYREMSMLWDQVSNQVREQVKNRVCEPVRRNQGWNQIWRGRLEGVAGSANADSASFYSFFRDVVGLDNPVFERFRALETLAMSCGFVRLRENVLTISDRPEQIHRDPQGRLHNDAGPSISFRDGWRLYHWHGTQVPGEWITDRPPTAKEVLAMENAERRRAGIEMIGWKNILNELNAVVIDEDEDPEIGTLFEAEFPRWRRTGRYGATLTRFLSRERFLRVRCGTGREFVLPVPPHVNTALEANAWTWDLESYEYRPDVRT